MVQFYQALSLQFEYHEKFEENFFFQLDFVFWSDLALVLNFGGIPSIRHASFHMLGFEL